MGYCYKDELEDQQAYVIKVLIKAVVNAAFLVLAFPLAALSLFGRVRALYTIFAQTCALAPGIPGDYLRVAFYRLTLTACSPFCRVSFGSFFAHPQARVADGVYIGSYCVLGKVTIGERTQIASGVQILSGSRQHSRDSDGRVQGGEGGDFRTISIGADCWIGAAAIVMADVGAQSTIGAGAIVTKPIPPGVVAVGNPARVVRAAEAAADHSGAVDAR